LIFIAGAAFGLGAGSDDPLYIESQLFLATCALGFDFELVYVVGLSAFYVFGAVVEVCGCRNRGSMKRLHYGFEDIVFLFLGIFLGDGRQKSGGFLTVAVRNAVVRLQFASPPRLIVKGFIQAKQIDLFLIFDLFGLLVDLGDFFELFEKLEFLMGHIL
jgi:hypothetical protein